MCALVSTVCGRCFTPLGTTTKAGIGYSIYNYPLTQSYRSYNMTGTMNPYQIIWCALINWMHTSFNCAYFYKYGFKSCTCCYWTLLLLQLSLSSTVLNILQSHEHCETIPPSEGHQTYYAITNILVQSHNPALYNHIILTTTYNLNTPFHLNSTPCCHPPCTLHYSFSAYRHPPCQCMQ